MKNREKQLEQKLRREINRLGGLCLKYFNPHEAGFPDRLILCPQGKKRSGRQSVSSMPPQDEAAPPIAEGERGKMSREEVFRDASEGSNRSKSSVNPTKSDFYYLSDKLCHRKFLGGFRGVYERFKNPSPVVWVEVKTKGKKPTRLQTLRHRQLQILGYPVFIVDDEESLQAVLDYVKRD